MSAESPKPVLVWDGDCDFCRRFILRWQAITGDRIDYAPCQEVRQRFPQISDEEFRAAIHFIDVDGTRSSGAEAVFRALALGGRGASLWLYRRAPGFAPVAEGVYRLVAAHRQAASRLTRWLVGDDLRPASYALSRRLFLALLGACFLIAFVSLRVQLDGLMGSRGIWPAADYLKLIHERLGSEGFYRVPTLLWFGCSDRALHWLCDGGALASILLIIGIAPRIMLLILWSSYLSLSTTGGVFMGYQWDALLLETGLLAFLFAPDRLLPGFLGGAPESSPSTAALWLMRWLLFRLMFLSGMVKLLSGDPSWRDLTALDYHYWSQPLPTWLAHYAHQLPDWFQRQSVAVMFAIEIGAPFAIFAPRRPRLLGAASILFLMVLTAATGNYNCFNLLTVALCIPLIDDNSLMALVPRSFKARFSRPGFPRRTAEWRIRQIPLLLACAFLFFMSSAEAISRLGDHEFPPWLDRWMMDVAPFRSINSYGLFAVMTKERHEIALEGSDDGVNWRTYEFKWKPGRLDRRPGFVEPHQPRLDWQMWFAALGDCRRNPWFLRFQQRLLEGVPQVAALLEENPFPDRPPRYLRSSTSDYRFSDEEERKRGVWWRRGEPLGAYCPPLMLENGQLAEARFGLN